MTPARIEDLIGRALIDDDDGRAQRPQPPDEQQRRTAAGDHGMPPGPARPPLLPLRGEHHRDNLEHGRGGHNRTGEPCDIQRQRQRPTILHRFGGDKEQLKGVVELVKKTMPELRLRR